MKKLMIFLVMMAGLLSFTESSAQRYTALPTIAGDTIANHDTVSKVIPATAGYSTGSFKVEYTKISGTVALKAYLYCGDGTDFDLTDSTAAFSNASGYVYINKTGGLPYSHYRVQVRPSTSAAATQSVKIVVKPLLKKYD